MGQWKRSVCPSMSIVLSTRRCWYVDTMPCPNLHSYELRWDYGNVCVCVCLWVGCVIFRWPLSNNKPSLLEPFAKNINAPTSLQIGMPTHKLHVVVRSDTIKTNGGRAGTNCKCYLVAISSALSGWSGLRAVKVKIIRVIRKTSKLIAGLLKTAAINIHSMWMVAIILGNGNAGNRVHFIPVVAITFRTYTPKSPNFCNLLGHIPSSVCMRHKANATGKFNMIHYKLKHNT